MVSFFLSNSKVALMSLFTHSLLVQRNPLCGAHFNLSQDFAALK
jgi:hypothetical protein